MGPFVPLELYLNPNYDCTREFCNKKEFCILILSNIFLVFHNKSTSSYSFGWTIFLTPTAGLSALLPRLSLLFFYSHFSFSSPPYFSFIAFPQDYSICVQVWYQFFPLSQLKIEKGRWKIIILFKINKMSKFLTSDDSIRLV